MNWNALLESEEFADFAETNKPTLQEIAAKMENFKNVMVEFVLNNEPDFMATNLEEVEKNINTFATYATHRYLAETLNLYKDEFGTTQSRINEGLSEYL